MLSYAKSATARRDWLNGFENGKTQLFNSWGVEKLAYFQKKWSVPLKKEIKMSKKSVMPLSCVPPPHFPACRQVCSESLLSRPPL